MRIIITGMICLLASVSGASGFNDIIESLAARAEEAAVSSEVEVVELFRAQTPEELEASLTDGYPMPWLAEILNDESIPEEDRYWLDCRVRAHVAKYLHRFYDRNGNPVDIEAEWISPGEHYWQEHLMVNPLGEDYGFRETPDYLPDFTGEPGTIVNLYGEQTGEMALTQLGIIMSRDGTIGILKTGPADIYSPLAPNYVCLIYSDGTFRDIEVDFIRQWEHINVSWDGELVVACCKNANQDQPNGHLQAFDHDGNTLYTTEIAGTASARPAISPDNRYIAVPLLSPIPRSIVILDAQTGELLRRFERWVRQVTFSPDSRCLGSAGNINGIDIMDISPNADSWEFNSLLSGDSGNYLGISLCNDQEITAVSGKIQARYSNILINEHEIYTNDASNLDLSPNGYFGFSFNSRRALGTVYEPSLVIVVSIRERG